MGIVIGGMPAITPTTWAFKNSYTVSGAARADMTVPSLDLETDGMYYIVAKWQNATTEKNAFIVNGDTTTTHYYTSKDRAAAANVYELSTNAPDDYVNHLTGFVVKTAGQQPFGYFIWQAILSTGSTNPAGVYIDGWLATPTTNVTSLALYGGSGGNHFDIGSWIKVYKTV